MKASYELVTPSPHVIGKVWRCPLGGIPGLRAACSCGASTWRETPEQIDQWAGEHQRLPKNGGK